MSWSGHVNGEGWGSLGKLSNPLSPGSIQKAAATLTSDQWQLFPQALPATASPLTAPDIPQPSGQGTQTRGLQAAESLGNHTEFSERSGKKRVLIQPSQSKWNFIQSLSDPWSKKYIYTTKFSISKQHPPGARARNLLSWEQERKQGDSGKE